MVLKLALGGLAALVSFGLVRWQLAGRFVEEPAYEVERDDGGFEVRRYGPTVLAETVVEAESSASAVNTGFRRLAGYIFGNNTRSEKLAMTAPVTQSLSSGETLAMTAPVTQSAEGAGRWRVTFTLPKGRTVADLPVPVDGSVSLRAVGARRVAVLRYSGTTPPERVTEQERALREALASAGLSPRSEAVSARYDPPSVLPFLRRNEVWLELAETPGPGRADP
ncbi:MAG: heme-binding protein [Myxococcaceae bacterium]|nr:heme-binding protein [Myxococcaceae bacterium]